MVWCFLALLVPASWPGLRRPGLPVVCIILYNSTPGTPAHTLHSAHFTNHSYAIPMVIFLRSNLKSTTDFIRFIDDLNSRYCTIIIGSINISRILPILILIICYLDFLDFQTSYYIGLSVNFFCKKYYSTITIAIGSLKVVFTQTHPNIYIHQ